MEKIIFQKLKITIIFCAILLLLSNVECMKIKNPGRSLDCWPNKLYFQEFEFAVYFSSRNHIYQLMKHGSVIGKSVDFFPKRRTAVIVHGLGGSSHEFKVKTLVDQLLLWQDMNVILLDWQLGAQNVFVYPQAAANTEYAAIILKELFVKLRQISDTEPQNWGHVHFIGHSLGAHVVGQAAEMLKKENLTIERVTGLDPAEPCFLDVNSPLRLRSSNARFVDVIHTDGATVPNERFGLLDKLGHADFYVNGGSVQPGCKNILRPKRYLDIGRIIQHATENGWCDHNRAFTLFIESVIQARTNRCKFCTHPWALDTNKLDTSRILSERYNEHNCVEMGINAELYNHNNAAYYVKTTGSAPYCNVAK